MDRYPVPDDIRARGQPPGWSYTARPGAEGAGPGPGGGAGAALMFPPDFYRPPSGVDFQAFGRGSGLNLASGPTVLTGGTFTIPSGRVGVIRSLVLSVNQLLTTSDILFALLFDGSPVPGWSGLQLFPRAASSVSLAYGPEETMLPVPAGSEVSVRATVNDGGTYDVGADYHGWHYSLELAAAWR